MATIAPTIPGIRRAAYALTPFVARDEICAIARIILTRPDMCKSAEFTHRVMACLRGIGPGVSLRQWIDLAQLFFKAVIGYAGPDALGLHERVCFQTEHFTFFVRRRLLELHSPKLARYFDPEELEKERAHVVSERTLFEMTTYFESGIEQFSPDLFYERWLFAHVWNCGVLREVVERELIQILQQPGSLIQVWMFAYEKKDDRMMSFLLFNSPPRLNHIGTIGEIYNISAQILYWIQLSSELNEITYSAGTVSFFSSECSLSVIRTMFEHPFFFTQLCCEECDDLQDGEELAKTLRAFGPRSTLARFKLDTENNQVLATLLTTVLAYTKVSEIEVVAGHVDQSLDAVFGILRGNVYLRKFTLHCRSIDSNSLESLADVLNNNATLQVLRICNNDEEEDLILPPCPSLNRALERNIGLQVFRLDFVDFDADEVVLWGSIVRSQRLTSLALRINTSGMSRILHLGAALAENTTLRDLTLQFETGCIDETAFFLQLSRQTTLRSLQLIEESHDVPVPNILQNRCSIEKLDLLGVTFFDDEAERVVRSLPGSNVRELTLNLSRVHGNRTIQALSEILKSDITLEKLAINSPGLNDEQIRLLANGLGENRSLLDLVLWIQCTEEGVLYFAQQLQGNQTLMSFTMIPHAQTPLLEQVKVIFKAVGFALAGNWHFKRM